MSRTDIPKYYTLKEVEPDTDPRYYMAKELVEVIAQAKAEADRTGADHSRIRICIGPWDGEYHFHIKRKFQRKAIR